MRLKNGSRFSGFLAAQTPLGMTGSKRCTPQNDPLPRQSTCLWAGSGCAIASSRPGHSPPCCSSRSCSSTATFHCRPRFDCPLCLARHGLEGPKIHGYDRGTVDWQSIGCKERPRTTPLPKRRNMGRLAQRVVSGNQSQAMYPRRGDDQPVGWVLRKRRGQLLRGNRDLHRQRQHLQPRRAGRVAQPIRPRSDGLPEHDPAVRQEPGGFLERDRGQADLRAFRSRSHRPSSPWTEPRITQDAPQPCMRVQQVLHERNHSSAEMIGETMSPRTVAVPLRQPSSRADRVERRRGASTATSRVRLTTTIVSPCSARRT